MPLLLPFAFLLFTINRYLYMLTQFEGTLVGISLSHSRAFLLAKCAGTYLQNAVVPVLWPMDFVRKKVESREVREASLKADRVAEKSD